LAGLSLISERNPKNLSKKAKKIQKYQHIFINKIIFIVSKFKNTLKAIIFLCDESRQKSGVCFYLVSNQGATHNNATTF
jgi:hypothetical protein